MYRLVRRSDRGAALMIALGILAIMGMLGGAFVVFMRIEQSRADYDLDGLRARYLARGAIEAARVRVGTAGTDPTGEISGQLGGGAYTATVAKVGNEYEVDAVGEFTRNDGSKVSRRILARMRPTDTGVRIGMWQE